MPSRDGLSHPLFNPNAEEPPGYTDPAPGARTCANCKMFDAEQGVCTGYGNRPVTPSAWCESWYAAPGDTTSEADRFLAPPPVIIPPGSSMADRIKLRYGSFGPPAESDDDLRTRIAAGDKDARAEALKRMRERATR